MPDTAAEARGPGIGAASTSAPPLAALRDPAKPGLAIKKRWRGWLRSLHRDFGYLAVGFTFIYAVSGIAINHLKDWDPNFHATEKTLSIAPIPAELPDAEAVKRVTDATGTGAPDDVFRAGDELRLSYSNGTQVTVVGDAVTVQARSPRFFLRVANWLHYNRGKRAWTIVADIYAVMLLYLAISGLFMIKGKLGLKWRGTILVGLGIAVPVTYVALSGGPNANNAKVAETSPAPAAEPVAKPSEAAPATSSETPPPADDGETLVIMVDSKATPTATEHELKKRRGKRRRKGGGRSPRHRGRSKRKNWQEKRRRKKGDHSKNGRAATLVVMYTLKEAKLPGGRKRLEGPINRRVYELARKHCGNQKQWQCSVETLHEKSGSTDTIRKLRAVLKSLADVDDLPDYSVTIDPTTDVVTFSKR